MILVTDKMNYPVYKSVLEQGTCDLVPMSENQTQSSWLHINRCRTAFLILLVLSLSLLLMLIDTCEYNPI